MSLLAAIAGFAILVILHELGHFVVAKAVGMRVEKFFLFFPPKLFSVTRGETEYGIGAIPLGGFVKITGMDPEEELEPEVAPRAYYAQPVWKRIVVIAAGPVVNIVLAFVILLLLATTFGLNGDIENRIGFVEEELPAAGLLQEGDSLLSVDGRNVADFKGVRLAEAVRSQLEEHSCAGEQVDGCLADTPVNLLIERDGERINERITPVYEGPQTVGGVEVEGRMRLGFGYGTEIVRESLSGGISFAADRMWEVTRRTGEVLAGIFRSETREQISGVVGTTEITRQSIEFDLRQAFGVLGLISLSLGLINLLPFLPLDGGHIFWSVLEKIRGKRASLAAMERSSVVGFVLVLMLFLIGLNNDLGRLFGEGFDVR